MRHAVFVLPLLAAGCLLEEDVSRELQQQQLLTATNASVKELVACGQLQYATIRNLAAAVVLETGHKETARLLFGDVTLERAPDGTYVVLMPSGKFSMSFGRRNARSSIKENVFSLAAYVQDPVLRAPASLEAWRNGDTTFSLSFSGPGPLFDLLAGGRSVTSPLVFTVTPSDVVELAWSNRLQGGLRGAFGQLLAALQIHSQLDYADTRSDVSVVYRMITPRGPVLDLLDGGFLRMNMVSLDARKSRLRLRTSAVQISYVDLPNRGLQGRIDYELFDEEDPASVRCRATADYGDGAVYGQLTGCE